jgi:NAD(P)-dependent dehydrogenase (short-subunit alcohol dehydrogenase family)
VSHVSGLSFQAEAEVFLQQKYGKIINTASMATLLVPHPQKQIAYNSSKAAVVKMTQTLACEWADRGVNVNCISPGIVETALITVRDATYCKASEDRIYDKLICDAFVWVDGFVSADLCQQ